MRIHHSLCLLTTLALAAAVPAAAQDRLDGALRKTMTDGFRAAAVQHRVSANLPTVGFASTPFLFTGAVAVTPADGLDGILRGEPYALTYFDGTGTTVPRGYYRLAIGSDGAALLLTATGATVGRGQASIDLIANPGTPYCGIEDPHPNDDTVCWVCEYGNPNGPVGTWSVSTCFAL